MKKKIICANCKSEMKKHVLDNYEYELGFPIKAECYMCEKCGNITFTEEQADLMKKRTKELRDKMFAFERRVSYSGKSLTILIPADLAEYLNMKRGQKVRMFPVNQEGFFVKVRD